MVMDFKSTDNLEDPEIEIDLLIGLQIRADEVYSAVLPRIHHRTYRKRDGRNR